MALSARGSACLLYARLSRRSVLQSRDREGADPAAYGATKPDLEQSETEERWFSIGIASSGVLLAVAYLWEAEYKGQGL
jgi:hypothetical protein